VHDYGEEHRADQVSRERGDVHEQRVAPADAAAQPTDQHDHVVTGDELGTGDLSSSALATD